MLAGHLTNTPPLLNTSRLRLRRLEPSDASAIQQAAGDRRIADGMISIPHPYPDGEGERYIASRRAEFVTGRSAAFTLRRQGDNGFCGLIELREIEREHSQGELSFWLAVEAWGHGFMREAVSEVVGYGFDQLGLNRLYAYHMLRNPASGRVLENNGFLQEGVLRQRVRKWGRFEDVALWAILHREWPDSADK